MAPIRPHTSRHSRAARSAKDPRGIYAPPSPTSTPPLTTEADAPSTADLHTAPSSSLKRKRQDDDDSFGFGSGFKVSKKDKRTIRHNTLLARVSEAGVQKRKLKRRRPGKKLKADMGGLMDALPDTASGGSGEEDEEDWEGIPSDAEDGEGAMEGLQGLRKAKRRRKVIDGKEGKMVMKSLHHRPGAMKRKRKMEMGEMERFKRNMAEMVGREAQSTGDAQEDGKRVSQGERWAALRKFIGGTMERDGAFAGAAGGRA